MLQAAIIDLFNPLIPKAHNSECQSLFPLQITPVKASLRVLFFAPWPWPCLGTIGLNFIWQR